MKILLSLMKLVACRKQKWTRKVKEVWLDRVWIRVCLGSIFMSHFRKAWWVTGFCRYLRSWNEDPPSQYPELTQNSKTHVSQASAISHYQKRDELTAPWPIYVWCRSVIRRKPRMFSTKCLSSIPSSTVKAIYKRCHWRKLQRTTAANKIHKQHRSLNKSICQLRTTSKSCTTTL